MKFYRKIFLAGISFVLMYAPDIRAQQKASWDSTSRPAVYAPLVEQFRTFPPRKKDVVLLGNSITFWGDWAERLGRKIKNQGIPGDNTFGVLNRIPEVTRNNPSKVFILIGINDLAANIPDSVILINYARIIDGIRTASPSTKIYFQTLLPTNASFKASVNHYHKEKNILMINDALKKMAGERNIKVVDLHACFTDASGNLIKDYSWDGVHLTQKGYARWIKVLKDGRYIK